MKNLKMPALHMGTLAAALAMAPAAVAGQVMAEAPVDAEALLKEVNQKLASLNGEVKQTAEDALKQAKASGDVSAETKATADKLLTTQNSLVTAVSALTDQLEGVAANNQEMAQLMAAGGSGAGGAPVMSMGQAVVADAEKIKAFLSAGASGAISFNVSNAITTAAGSGGGLIFPNEETDPVRMARRTLRILDLIGRGKVSTDMVKYVRQTLRTDATAAVAETGTYPVSAFGWAKAEAGVKKLGAIVHVSEETVADAVLLQSEIDGELRYGLDLEIEKQVLAGDGVGENLLGLIPSATAFAAAAGLPNANGIDRLRLALLQVVLADYVPNAIVLNPTDWAGIDLLKDGQSRFVFGNPGAQSTPKLWGKDVAESNTMSVGEWLVGDLQMAATLYDRSEAEVLISSEHGTNFVEDMLTMKARKRVALAQKRPAAMVTGNFTFI